MFTVGGHFKMYQDPRGKDHIGTITLCLPSFFTGGEAVIQQKYADETDIGGGETTLHPETETVTPVLSWTLIGNSGRYCTHEILPVMSGTRVTVTYDVFAPFTKAPSSDQNVKRLAATLSAAAKDHTFLPNGGVLAFALENEYPFKMFDDHITIALIERDLKGADATLLEAVRAAGLARHFFPVFICWCRDCWAGSSPSTQYTIAYSRHVLDKRYPRKYGDWQRFKPPCRHLAKRSPLVGQEVMWIVEPQFWQASDKRPYVWMRDGQPKFEWVYLSTALCVWLPPPTERVEGGLEWPEWPANLRGERKSGIESDISNQEDNME